MSEIYIERLYGHESLEGYKGTLFLITKNPDAGVSPDSIICFNESVAEFICDLIDEHNNLKIKYESTMELKEALYCLKMNKGSLDDNIVETLVSKIYDKPRERVENVEWNIKRWNIR